MRVFELLKTKYEDPQTMYRERQSFLAILSASKNVCGSLLLAVTPDV